MKKILLTLTLIVTSISLTNAAELDLLDKQLLNNDPIKTVSKTQIYQWTVKTPETVFTGTSKTLKEANNQIASLTKYSKVIQKEVATITLSSDNNTKHIYTWSVVTDRGYATGVATSLEQANTMLKLLGSTEVPKSNIIETIKPINNINN